MFWAFKWPFVWSLIRFLWRDRSVFDFRVTTQLNLNMTQQWTSQSRDGLVNNYQKWVIKRSIARFFVGNVQLIFRVVCNDSKHDVKTKNAPFFMIFPNISFFYLIVIDWTGPLKNSTLSNCAIRPYFTCSLFFLLWSQFFSYFLKFLRKLNTIKVPYVLMIALINYFYN